LNVWWCDKKFARGNALSGERGPSIFTEINNNENTACRESFTTVTGGRWEKQIARRVYFSNWRKNRRYVKQKMAENAVKGQGKRTNTLFYKTQKEGR